MEGDRLPDVLVPITPFVAAGIFVVFMNDPKFIKMFMEISILREEEVVATAIEPERGDDSVIGFFDDRERIFGTSRGRLAEDPREFGLEPAGARSKKTDRPRM